MTPRMSAKPKDPAANTSAPSAQGKKARSKSATKSAPSASKRASAPHAAKSPSSRGASSQASTRAKRVPSRNAASSKATSATVKRALSLASAKAAETHSARKGNVVVRGARAVGRSYFVRFIAVLVFVVAAAFIGVSGLLAHTGDSVQRPDGLPAYITDEMISTARAMRQEYGHPTGCTIAQIIQESGQGTHPSRLAEEDNNLFGMKWSDSFAGKHGVIGPATWGTNEEYDGETISITDAFIEFESQKACIEFRSSVFLQSSTYADNPTIKRAIETNNSALMAWGLQDAGWATDGAYAEHLIAVMDRYDLYRFDS